LLRLLWWLLAAGSVRIVAGSVGCADSMVLAGIVGGSGLVASCSRGFAWGSLVCFVMAWLLGCNGIRLRHGARGAKAQSGDSKLCEHASPECFEASALWWRQVIRQGEERERLQGGAESFELCLDVPRSRREGPALRGVGPKQTQRLTQ
jgi:hypothetical protein